jgi:proline dehydrogenase
MMRNAWPLLLLLAACGEGQKDLGSQTADVISDTEALKQANAAANRVIRAAGDCEAVKAALAETSRVLDEVQQKVRTETGRTTLDALRKQVRTIAETCP